MNSVDPSGFYNYKSLKKMPRKMEYWLSPDFFVLADLRMLILFQTNLKIVMAVKRKLSVAINSIAFNSSCI